MKKQVIHGTGLKKLLVISGLHGNEYTPVSAVAELFLTNASAFLAKLSEQYSQITVLHAVNEYGLIKGLREASAPTDLNRLYQTIEPIDLIKDEVEAADVIIDVHSSPNCAEFLLINQGDYANRYVEFAKEHGIKYLLWDDGHSATLKSYALTKNKVAFTIECNGIQRVDNRSAAVARELISKIALNAVGIVVAPEAPKYKSMTKPESICTGLVKWISDTEYSITNLQTMESVVGYLSEGTPITWEHNGYIEAGDVIAYVQPNN
jgi:predicted deacylase